MMATRRTLASGLLCLPAALAVRPLAAQQAPPLPEYVPVFDRTRLALLRGLFTSEGFRQSLAGADAPPAVVPVSTFAPDAAHYLRVHEAFLAWASRTQSRSQHAQLASADSAHDSFLGERLAHDRPITASGTDLVDQFTQVLKLLVIIAQLTPQSTGQDALGDPVLGFVRLRAQVVRGDATTPALLALDEAQRREAGIWLGFNHAYLVGNLALADVAQLAPGPAMPPALAAIQTRTRTLLRDVGLDHATLVLSEQGLRTRPR